MQLEDHAGDILRKARAMNGVSAEAAARAGGLAEAELTQFETTGVAPPRLNYAALASAAGLDWPRLKAIADGWRPAPPDLRQWRELRVFTTANERFSVNCFLVWDAATRDAALLDTGLDAAPVLAVLAAERLALRHIFITHSHWDHVEALPAVRAAFPAAQLHSGSPNAPAARRLRPGETFALGALTIAVRPTPGHAPDGVTYVITGWPENPPPNPPLNPPLQPSPVAVVGDTIFAGSMGNGNGAWDLARQKIREEILSLPPATLLCPGHGPLTTVAEERAHNPFFAE